MNDITCQEVKIRLEENQPINLFDVREEWEFEERNIGATCIPLGDLPTRISEIEHLKNEEVVLHCKSGTRSLQAKKFLLSHGFVNVRSMTGGITEYLAL